MRLKDLQIQTGAVFRQVHGVDVADHYGDSALEYGALKSSAGIFDLSQRGKLRLGGKDRTRFLHGMITNTVEGLVEGAGNHASITSVHGQTLLDLWVHQLGDYLWLATEPGFQSTLYESLDRYLIADDVVMTDETDDWTILGVAGPHATEKVAGVMGLALEDLPEHHTAQGELPEGPTWVTHRSPGGLDRFDIRIAAAEGGKLWQNLVASGLTPVGVNALEVLRVESGIPRCGVEIDGRDTPLEAGLADTVDFNKGCYIGQEVIAKMHFRGKPRRYLVGIRIGADEPLVSGSDVVVDGKAVGRITSCLYSAVLEGIIALAIVRRGVHQPGQPVEVGNSKGEIVELPFLGSAI